MGDPEASVGAPLLPKDEEGRRPEGTWKLWKADLRDVFALSAPACLQLLFQYAVIVTNQSFAGHLGANELAAAAIAVTAFNFLWYFLLGLSSALDTLASQAYGANDRAGVIAWSVTTAVCMSVLAIPMGVILYFGDFLAIYIFQQPPVVADLVAIYCQGMIPGLLPLVWSIVIMKAMQAQNIMWGPTWMTVGMFFANLGLNYVGISLFGFWGVAYAQSAGRIVQFLLLVLYVFLVDNECLQYDKPCWIVLADDTIEATGDEVAIQTPIHQAMNGATEDEPHLIQTPVKAADLETGTTTAMVVREGFTLTRIGIFLKLGLPGGFMMAADASAFDITTAMAGFLGTVEVGAHTALLTLCVFIYMAVPFGIATAATIRVGNMLGAGNPAAARRTSWLTLGLCLIYSGVVTILIAALNYRIGYIFTSAPVVVKLVGKIAFLAAIYQLPDAVYGVFSGVLRGMGRQAQLVLCNVGGFWVVGTVTGYLLAFQAKLGVAGLWIGINCGVATCAVVTSALIYFVDWEYETQKAKELVVKADMAGFEIEEQKEEAADGLGSDSDDYGSGGSAHEVRPLASEVTPIPSTRFPGHRRRGSRDTSRTTSRASSPEGRLIRRVGSVTSHHSHGSVPYGSLSSHLTGSYIVNLQNKDFASGAFRRV